MAVAQRTGITMLRQAATSGPTVSGLTGRPHLRSRGSDGCTLEDHLRAVQEHTGFGLFDDVLVINTMSLAAAIRGVLVETHDPGRPLALAESTA